MMSSDVRVSPTVLSIAGFDPGGGAGIIADIKTFSAFNVYGTAVITTLTAQNHTDFSDMRPVDQDMLKNQLDAVFNGYDIKAVKIGLLPYPEVLSTVADCLYKKKMKIVTDPVFSATSGRKFVSREIIDLYKERLFPISSIITPNTNELSILTNKKISDVDDMIKAAKKLYVETGIPVLAKGGHLKNKAVDVLIGVGSEKRFESEIYRGIDTHGSGCILSSAICANLANGKGIEKSVEISKNFIKKLLNNGRNIKKTGNILDPLSDYFG